MNSDPRLDDFDGDFYVDEKWISRRMGISHTSLWRWQKEGRFPKATRLSPRMCRWLKSELLAWEADRRAEGGNDERS
jgi:predicted DNA-binding transcriptional regulator AlpA